MLSMFKPHAIARVVVALVATGALVACGGGDDDARPEETSSTVGADSAYADALAKTIGGFKEALGLSTEQTFCLANGLVDAYGGASGMEAAGVTPEMLETIDSPAEAGLASDQAAVDKAAETVRLCEIDVVAMFIDGIAVTYDVGPDAEACFRERLDKAQLEQLIAAQLVTGELADAPEDVATKVLPCLEMLGAQGQASATSGA